MPMRASIRSRRSFRAIRWSPSVPPPLLDQLAPGGRLVYATCSVLRAENQRVVADFLEQTTDAVGAPGAAPSGRQIFPGEAKMDGFYYACLLKGR